MAFTDELRNDSIAGIPVWGIGLALAGIVVVIVAIKRRSTPPPSTETPDNAFVGSVDNTGNVGPLNPVDQYLQNDPTNPAYPVGLTAQGLPGPITNEQWARLSFDWLIGKGDDPTLVENALRKYLDGQPLSAQEEAVKNLAQQTFGAPPEGLIQTTVAPIASNVTNTGTSVATPAPQTTRTGPMLRRGSTGPAVTLLQQLLNQHGANLATDGQFGPLTDQAVRNFQRSVGIAVDGIVGPITWSKL